VSGEKFGSGSADARTCPGYKDRFTG